MDSLQDDDGVRYYDHAEDIVDIIIVFYQDLFTIEGVVQDLSLYVDVDGVVSVVGGRVHSELKNRLEPSFTREEVYQTIEQMHPLKGPGQTDYQHFCIENFSNDVTHLVLAILNHEADMKDLNHTFICLIPNVKNPKHAKYFRAISLCNVIFEIITKIIANRIKLILPFIVGPYQSAFILRRLTIDNALDAFEIFYYMRKKRTCNISVMGLKLDMAKAYDRI